MKLFAWLAILVSTQLWAEENSKSEVGLKSESQNKISIYTSPIGLMFSRFNLGLGYSPLSQIEVGPKATIHSNFKRYEIGLRTRLTLLSLANTKNISSTFLFVRGGLYRKIHESARAGEMVVDTALDSVFGGPSYFRWESVNDWMREVSLGFQFDSRQGVFGNVSGGLDWYRTRHFAQNRVTGEITEDKISEVESHFSFETNIGFNF